MSKQEEVFADKMDLLFPDFQVLKNWRPNLLKNKKTGCNLEIDYYIGKYRMGFEYQGGVHFKDIRKYNNNSDKSRYSDMLKYDLIKSNVKNRKRPLTIIEVFPQDLDGNFKNNILQRLNNSVPYYMKNGSGYNALNIIYTICYLETGLEYNQKNLDLNIIPEEYILMVERTKKRLDYKIMKEQRLKKGKFISSEGLNKTYYQPYS